ncbi:hypothetical protein [Aquabacterium humicola]|uniref:hypothetical protein n=1 Tax=Aquabacterium humicola TaxID=3237377 RepID=UPI0025428AD5|nr:hypothetical protein [Rubrivivax pictus]
MSLPAIRILVLVLTTAVQVACASAPATVDELIGDAACTGDAECRTVGIGALACGGPQGYRAWSVRRTDEAALMQAVQQQRQEREQQIAKRGEMSICRVVPDPGARCALPAGRCVLRADGAPGGAAAVR